MPRGAKIHLNFDIDETYPFVYFKYLNFNLRILDFIQLHIKLSYQTEEQVISILHEHKNKIKTLYWSTHCLFSKQMLKLRYENIIYIFELINTTHFTSKQHFIT